MSKQTKQPIVRIVKSKPKGHPVLGVVGAISFLAVASAGVAMAIPQSRNAIGDWFAQRFSPEFAQITTDKDTLQISNGLYAKQVEQLNTDISNKTTQLDSVTNQKSAIEAQLSIANETIITLEGSISALSSQKNDLEAQLSTANADKASLSAQIESINSTLVDTQTQLAVVTNQKVTLKTQLSSANSDIEILQNDIQDLQSQKTALENDITSTTEAKNALEAQLAEKINSYNTLVEQKTNIETQLETANTTIATLHDNIATLSAQKSTLETQLSIANETITTLEGDISTLTSQKTELETQLSTANADKASLSAQISEKDATISTLQEDIALLQATLAVYTPYTINIDQTNPASSIVVLDTNFNVNYQLVDTSSSHLQFYSWQHVTITFASNIIASATGDITVTQVTDSIITIYGAPGTNGTISTNIAVTASPTATLVARDGTMTTYDVVDGAIVGYEQSLSNNLCVILSEGVTDYTFTDANTGVQYYYVGTLEQASQLDYRLADDCNIATVTVLSMDAIQALIDRYVADESDTEICNGIPDIMIVTDDNYTLEIYGYYTTSTSDILDPTLDNGLIKLYNKSDHTLVRQGKYIDSWATQESANDAYIVVYDDNGTIRLDEIIIDVIDNNYGISHNSYDNYMVIGYNEGSQLRGATWVPLVPTTNGYYITKYDLTNMSSIASYDITITFNNINSVPLIQEIKLPYIEHNYTIDFGNYAKINKITYAGTKTQWLANTTIYSSITQVIAIETSDSYITYCMTDNGKTIILNDDDTFIVIDSNVTDSNKLSGTLTYTEDNSITLTYLDGTTASITMTEEGTSDTYTTMTFTYTEN